MKRDQQVERFKRDMLARGRRGFFKVGDRSFQVEAVSLLAERLASLEVTLLAAADRLASQAPATANGRKKRKPNAYSRFFGEGMKAGKSPAQIGREWKAQKGGSV